MKKKVLTMAVIGAVFLSVGVSFEQTALAESNQGLADRYAVARLNTVKENHLAFLRSEALRQAKDIAAAGRMKDAGPASSWLSKVSADEVNMVTNRHEKKRQGEVNLENRPYYCSGEAYVQTLAKNPSLRFAQDPLTSKRVDKSEAVIYADASGAVYYFESEDTYKGFLSLTSTENI